MPKTKQYTTPEQQIAKLKSQNLAFGDEKRAELSLSLFGYFNLIKGYRDPYVINNGSGISYRSGMTFEQICSLYLLDKNLRNAVIAAMLDLEEYVKEAVQLLQLLSLMEYQGPYRHLDRVLNHEFTRHFNEYPEDITYLSSILNIDIRVQEFVWISGKSKRFHSAQHCSGMSNAFRIDYAKAIESGYVPCKRCCKNADLN